MTIYASTSTRNTDPTPWAYEGFGVTGRSIHHIVAPRCEWDPRPEFKQSRAHDGNPILIASREQYDKSDPWGFALGWLDAVENYQGGFGYDDAADAETWGASYERIAVWHLATASGEYSLPQATRKHLNHARRVFDRMADVARANGLNY